MLTADGVEIVPDMDLWDIDGLRYEPAAINFVEPDPENWASGLVSRPNPPPSPQPTRRSGVRGVRGGGRTGRWGDG